MSGPSSVLSDGTIRRLVQEGRIRIDPWDPDLVQPASVDLRLGDSFRVFHNHRASAIDLRRPPENLTEEVVVPPGESFVIHPGEFCLGRTLEWVELPDDVVARIEGKALALDTVVPTPFGASTMGGLEPGEWVLDAEGRPTPVVGVSEVMVGRPCLEVEFGDGTVVVADRDHRWRTWVDGRPRIVTTVQLDAAHSVIRPSAPVVAGGDRTFPCISGKMSVASVREAPSVPVRCIQVGAPDGMFLVTQACIPTHNSSLGRLGLIVHATAGFCDPGWKGTLTLELNNLTRVPIKLYPELEIAQLSFMMLDRPAVRPYGSPELGSHYQGQRAATASRYRAAPGHRAIG